MEPGKHLPSGPDWDRFNATLHSELNGLRIAELKPIIIAQNLTRTGNKSDLVTRIAECIDRLNNSCRYGERDRVIALVRDASMRTRGYSTLPRLVSSLATAHISGGGGEGSNPGATGVATIRLNLGGVKPEAPASAHASLATLGRSQQGGGGGAGVGHSSSIQCVCGQNSTPWDEMVCAQCGKAFHEQCYGPSMRQRNRTYPPACFACLSLKQNPFMKVERTLLLPMRVGNRPKFDYVYRFHLSHEHQKDINPTRRGEKGSKGEGALQVVVRCFPLNIFEMTKGRAAQESSKPPFCPPHCWPLESQLRVNGDYVQIKQRQVYWHGTQRKWKGHSEPVDIYMNCHSGNNTVVLTHNDDKPFVFLVQLVRVVSVEQLFQRVTESLGGLSMTESLERIKKSFKSCSVDSDDEAPMATVTRLSLRCPLGLTPIQTPARGKDCQHLQCFDLDTFLRYNERGAAAGWKCGVCNATLAVDELKVDAFIHDIIKQLKGKEANEDGGGTIQIDHHGEWKVFDAAAAANSRKRKVEEAANVGVDDDDDDEDIPIASLNTKPPAQSAPAPSSHALPPPPSVAPAQHTEAIDLTFSSDEEDEDRETQQSSSSIVEVVGAYHDRGGGGGGGGGGYGGGGAGNPPHLGAFGGYNPQQRSAPA